MMPKALETLGLSAAISDMLEKSFQGTAIRSNFEQLGKEKRLDENIEIGCYRIVQELINNIIKHAQASEIDVQLIFRDEHFSLLLEENGRGFDPTNQEKMGHGLSNIMLRTKIIQGTIAFEAQEIGMLTTLKIPLTLTPHVQND